MNYGWKKCKSDIERLRELAEEYMQIATGADMQRRVELWQAHNDLEVSRPLILVESKTAGLQREIFGVHREFRCEEKWAQSIEGFLEWKIWHHKNVCDDEILHPFFGINWFISDTGYGVEVKTEHHADAAGGELGFHWEPPIKDIVEDFHKLKKRELSVDRNKSLAWKNLLEECFADIMPVKFRSGYGCWSLGLTRPVIDLIGLESLMLYMYDQPEALHRLMAYMRDDHLGQIDFMENEGLLSLNNGADYIGSGSRGATQKLGKDVTEGEKVMRKNLWCLSESQETVGVSPDMFAEFVLPYQKTLCESFGYTYYGCCEPINGRWEQVKTIKNLHSVSVSAWANENIMAEFLERNYVYSRKPNPTMLSINSFDADYIRADIRNTLTTAKGCNVELIMKDLHTTNKQPERMGHWVRICREEIAKAGW